MDTSRLRVLWWLGLIAFAAVLYHDTLSHEFSFDDYGVITRNGYIRDLSNLSALFSPERYFYVSGESTYRPAVTVAYFLEAAAFGLRPESFHAVNILFHAMCGVLTAWLGLRLGMSRFHAMFAAALFLAHPVATEAVNSVGFLEDLLALFFVQMSLVCVLRGRRETARSIAAATAFYLLALLSKEVAIFFPVAALMLLRHEGWGAPGLKRLGYALGSALAVYLVLRFLIFHPPFESGFGAVGPPTPETLFMMATVAVNYIRLFFAPIGLSASHVIPPHPELTWDVLLSFGVLAGFGVLVWRSSAFAVRWGGLWCLLFFLPVSQILPTAQISAERFMYVPLFGATLALAAAWERQFSFSASPDNANAHGSYAEQVSILWSKWVPCGAVLVLSVLTLQRNPVWRTHDSIFLDALKKNPHNVTALGALGTSAFDRGQYDLSETYFTQGLKEDPTHNSIANRLATIYYLTRRYADAIRILEQVVVRNSQDSHAHLMMAWSLWMTGQQERGREFAEKAERAGLRTPEERKALEDLKERMKQESAKND